MGSKIARNGLGSQSRETHVKKREESAVREYTRWERVRKSILEVTPF